ncbi:MULTISPECIES: hypothetical protein [unclassified Rhizobium]|uniref:hypothetical protein n=1 Tax=unclassified Rhizobium TaxID=2613769 RepID=UPI0006F9B7AC|nr:MULTISPECIES: hypothetical protein [unclassified Rhizobium]KQV34821.1 hypothetical protein ASC86_14040 [Rhizobium sp. Root1212]KRD24154.1 hypothetical protein ASE37_14035 [Rhizobium sp. Root268]
MFLSAELLQEVASFWFQAPLVISSRLRDFTILPGSAMETNRMITEKLSAAAESFVALNAAMAKEGLAAAAALATGRCAGVMGASDRLAVAALKPYGKRIRANARRLVK